MPGTSGKCWVPTSRTHAELALMTADIPAGLAAAPHLLSPALANGNLPAHAGVRPDDRAVGATLGLAALVFIAAFFAPCRSGRPGALWRPVPRRSPGVDSPRRYT